MNARSFSLAVSGLAIAATTMMPAAAGTAAVGAHFGSRAPTSGSSLLGARAASQSLNWAGYAVLPSTGQQITGVNSTFVVPAVNNTTPGFAATWTGIGGYNTSDLIQAGVGEQFAPGLGPSYYAWYEILPASETTISGCAGDANCTVNAGDKVTVSIQQTSPGQWSVDLADAGHWTYTTSLAYTSTYSSAEWILEAPTVAVQTVMPMMANAVFDPNNSFNVNGGAAQTLGAGSPVQITNSGFEGTVSAIDADGDGFTACAYQVSCAAPSS